jgi:DNA-directed RNA polymerase subunit alpha
MIEIEKPNIECVELSDDNRYGKFIIEPLERGFGTTLGNALRRVLLSSLPGVAVTSVKIEGVLHEFSTLPGVAEDVTEILLNLKDYRPRSTPYQPKTVTISATGPCMTAGDISADAEVDILNPDLYIASLNEDGSLYMEITLEKGRGYVSAERNKQPGQAIGIIPVDSIFTPIRKVNFTVENTRVGQQTDYDKLTIEIWTNGSIRPDEAGSLAAKFMSEHLKLFIDPHGRRGQRAHHDRERGGPQEMVLEMTIEELDLTVRSYNCLKRAASTPWRSWCSARGGNDESAQSGPQIAG